MVGKCLKKLLNLSSQANVPTLEWLSQELKYCEDVEGDRLLLLVEMYSGTTTMKIFIEVPQKTKDSCPIIHCTVLRDGL